MSLIKKDISQFKPVTSRPAQVPVKPVTSNRVQPLKSVPVAEAPTESFVPTVQQPLEENKQTVAEGPPKKLSTPRPGSDMADMLENIEASKLAGGELKSSPNGTLFVTQDGLISYGSPETQQGKAEEKPQTLEQMLASVAAEATAQKKTESHGHEHPHGHSKHGEDAAMGGHLGTEVVEKVGHHAHHAPAHVDGHAVAEASGHAKGHATAEAAGTAKGHGSHSVAEATGTAKGHGGHALTEAVGHAKSQGASHAGELVGDAVQASQSGAHGLAEVHEATSEAAKHGAEVGHHLSTGLTTALGASAVASGGIGAYMLYAGGKELAHGVKEKDGEKIAEGVGGLAVGARSVAAGTVMASMASGSGVLADVASVATQTLTPLGLVHGAVDVGLGVKDLVKGDKVDGLIKVGFGTTVIAGALVGGIPLTIAALGMLGLKVGRGIAKARKAKNAAQQAETIPQHDSKPKVQPDPNVSTKDAKT